MKRELSGNGGEPGAEAERSSDVLTSSINIHNNRFHACYTPRCHLERSLLLYWNIIVQSCTGRPLKSYVFVQHGSRCEEISETSGVVGYGGKEFVIAAGTSEKNLLVVDGEMARVDSQVCRSLFM